MAVFSGLTLARSSIGYSLIVTSGSLSSVTTNSFAVTGNPISVPAKPNGPEFQVNTYTTGAQIEPKVASDSAGDYVFVWQSLRAKTAADMAFMPSAYNAAGIAQGGEFRVYTYTTGNQRESHGRHGLRRRFRDCLAEFWRRRQRVWRVRSAYNSSAASRRGANSASIRIRQRPGTTGSRHGFGG